MGIYNERQRLSASLFYSHLAVERFKPSEILHSQGKFREQGLKAASIRFQRKVCILIIICTKIWSHQYLIRGHVSEL